MGLDAVEFVMAVEVAFGIDIANRDAEQIRTPGDVLRYLHGRLPHAASSPCLSQRAFYRARSACVTRFRPTGQELRPGQSLTEIIPPAERSAHWKALGTDLGAETWPPFREPTWIGRHFGSGPDTLGGLANYMAVWNAATVKASGGWTDAEIERIVVALIESEFGVDMAKHTLDSSFTEDMGVD